MAIRKIKYIAIHCTAGSRQATVDDLWAEFRRKGWKNPGYHYVVTADGKIHQLLDTEKVSNGVKGYNNGTVNIAYTGGVDGDLKATDNRTEAQKASMAKLVRMLHGRFPSAVIQGHRDFPGVSKACPCFDVGEWLKEININQ